MSTKIKLTEDQLDRMMKRLVSERSPVMTDTEYANYNSQYANTPTASWERKPNYKGKTKSTISVSGTESFDSGKSDVKKDSKSVKNAVEELKYLSQGSGGVVTVNGLSSKTSWGGSPANSKEAINKNLELAKTRRDNMVKYLKSLNLKGIQIVTGTANVADSDKPENQKITLDISHEIEREYDIAPKGDIGDNTRTVAPLYPKANFPPKQTVVPGTLTESRVCSKIPSKYVSELKKVIYNWGKTKGLKIPISDKTV